MLLLPKQTYHIHYIYIKASITTLQDFLKGGRGAQPAKFLTMPPKVLNYTHSDIERVDIVLPGTCYIEPHIIDMQCPVYPIPDIYLGTTSLLKFFGDMCNQ